MFCGYGYSLIRSCVIVALVVCRNTLLMVLGLYVTRMNSRNNYDQDQEGRKQFFSVCARSLSAFMLLFFTDVFLTSERDQLISFTSLDDDENSSGCVCWLLFLFKSLIHRISFRNLCSCANEKHFLELLSCLSLCSLLLYLKCTVLVNHDALL